MGRPVRCSDTGTEGGRVTIGSVRRTSRSSSRGQVSHPRAFGGGRSSQPRRSGELGRARGRRGVSGSVPGPRRREGPCRCRTRQPPSHGRRGCRRARGCPGCSGVRGADGRASTGGGGGPWGVRPVLPPADLSSCPALSAGAAGVDLSVFAPLVPGWVGGSRGRGRDRGLRSRLSRGTGRAGTQGPARPACGSVGEVV